MAPPDKKKGKQEILRHGGAIRILSLELLGFKNLLSPGNSQELISNKMSLENNAYTAYAGSNILYS